MVGYHLMTKGHSVSWGLGGAVPTAPPLPPQQVQGSVLIITSILILIFLEFHIKSQSNLSLKFLIKWFFIKKQHAYQTYDKKYLNAAGK